MKCPRCTNELDLKEATVQELEHEPGNSAARIEVEFYCDHCEETVLFTRFSESDLIEAL